MNPRNGNYGRGFGDYFGYRELLEQWLDGGDCEGLELDVRPPRRERRPSADVNGSSSSPAAAAASAPPIAEELGRTGAFVVTVDPLVSVDGAEQLPDARGDHRRPHRRRRRRGPGLVGLGHRRRRRPRACSPSWSTSTAGSTPWSTSPASPGPPASPRAPRTTGAACSPSTSTATSTSSAPRCRSWRRPAAAASSASPPGRAGEPADTGAYGCAKRAVAALTWQLGRRGARRASSSTPCRRSPSPGWSPPRSSRAPAAGPRPGRASATGGLSLGSMPEPEELGPAGRPPRRRRLLVVQRPGLFAGGSEVAVIDEPRLLEVVRTDGVASLAHVLDVAVTGRFAPAEARQASGGGSNPRFGVDLRRRRRRRRRPRRVRSCAIVSRPPRRRRRRSPPRSTASRRPEPCDRRCGIRHRLRRGAARPSPRRSSGIGPLDAVVVALAAAPRRARRPGGSRCSPSTRASSTQIHADAAWARAVADHAAQADRPVRLVTLTDATTAGGRSRAQAVGPARPVGPQGHRRPGRRRSRSASRRRGARRAARRRAGRPPAVQPDDAPALSGAELVAGAGWIGLRSHPRPSGSIDLRRTRRSPTGSTTTLRRIVDRHRRRPR